MIPAGLVRPSGLRIGQIVEVLGDTSTGIAYGSGYQITPTLVLTAAHVVDGASALRVRFGTSDQEVVPVRVAWRSAPRLDLAVLTLGRAVPVEEPATLGYVPARATDRRVPCEVMGFPAVVDSHPAGPHDERRGRFRDSLRVQGSTGPGTFTKSGLLDIRSPDLLDVPALELPGLSGAPVFCHGFLVGVVVQAARGLPGTLVATPLHLAWRTGNSHHPRPDVADVVRGLLHEEGGDPRFFPAYDRPYVPAIAEIHARSPSLIDRDAELGRLGRWLRDGPELAVWLGEPWAGKTALAAGFLAGVPSDVDAVAYFLSSARASTGEAMVASLVQQLAALAGEADATPDADSLYRLCAEARRAAEAAGRTLLLVVDGLDEPESRRAIAGLLAALPLSPGAATRVLLMSRRHPVAAGWVPQAHPLADRTRTQVIRLEPNDATRSIRSGVEWELARLLEDGDLPLQVLRVLSLLGPLSRDDLTVVLRSVAGIPSESAISSALTSGASGRMLITLGEREARRYAVYHDIVREQIDQQTPDEFRHRLHDGLLTLIAGYASAGWPEDTPDVLTANVVPFLARFPDAVTIDSLARSPEWLARSSGRSREQGTIDTLRAALRVLAAAGATSPSAVMALMQGVLPWAPPSYDLPADLVEAWAVAGSWPHAELLAGQSFRGNDWRIRVLRRLAARAADQERPEKATALLASAVECLAAIDVDAEARKSQRAAEQESRWAALGTARDRYLAESAESEPSGTNPVAAEQEPPAAENPDIHRRRAIVSTARQFLDLSKTAEGIAAFSTARSLSTEAWLLALDLPPGEHADFWQRLARSAELLGLENIRAGAATRLETPAATPHPAGSDDSQTGPPRPSRPTLKEVQEAADWGIDGLEDVRSALELEDFTAAAHLLDVFVYRPASLTESLLGMGSSVAQLALKTALQAGPASRPFLIAAEAYLAREGPVQHPLANPELGWWTWESSISMFPATAGDCLAHTIAVLARSGQQATILTDVTIPNGPEGPEILAAVALGSALGGSDSLADRIIPAIQTATGARVALNRIARHWATTERWRGAAELAATSTGRDRHIVESEAAATGIRRGDIEDAVALLNRRLDHLTTETESRGPSEFTRRWPGESLLAAATAALDTGQAVLARSLMREMPQPEELVEGLCRLADWESAHHETPSRAEGPGAGPLVQAHTICYLVRTSSDRADAWARLMISAHRRALPELESKAYRRAVHTIARMAPTFDRMQAHLELAQALLTVGRAGDSHKELARACRLAAKQRKYRILAVHSVLAAAQKIGQTAQTRDLWETIAGQETSSASKLLDLAQAAATVDDPRADIFLFRAMEAADEPAPGSFATTKLDVLLHAARLGRWQSVTDLLAATHGALRADAHATMAALAAGRAPELAATWAVEALLTEVTPLTAAAAAIVDSRAAPEALHIILPRPDRHFLPTLAAT